MRSLAAALLLCATLPAAARPVPALTGPVVDEAGLLDGSARRRLEALARAAWEQPEERRVQLQFLLVRSLDGDAVEDFAVRVFETWKLGSRGKDNGVLVVVSQEDRKVRIETGYGAEGGLTDAQAGRIIRNTMTPAFREGRFGDGLQAAGVEILAALGALPEGVRAPARQRASPGLAGWVVLLIALAVFSLIARVFSASFGPRRRRFWYGGGPWGGLGGGFGGGGGLGGGGGFGGGGGGWGGGGGSSGGGGASGSW